MKSLTIDSNSTKWLETTGGPLLLVSLEQSKKWKGVLGPHYDLGIQVYDEVETMVIEGCPYVLLGEEAYPTTFLKAKGGGCIVRWVYGEEDQGMWSLIRQSAHQLDRSNVATTITTGPSGTLLLFDSSLTGSDLGGEFREIHLDANTTYGLNWEYIDLSSHYRILACNIIRQHSEDAKN